MEGRIVRLAEAKRMAWKDGGGETAEVAVHPPNSGLDAFGWRVSLATITANGPFSAFPGVDRTFAVVDGAVALAIGSGRPTRLDDRVEPIRFAGAAACRCNLLGGPATALNVMVRSGSFDCAVMRLRETLAPPRIRGATTLLVCGNGPIATGLGPLEPRDVLILPPYPATAVGLGPVSAGTTIVSLWPAGGRRDRRGPGERPCDDPLDPGR